MPQFSPGAAKTATAPITAKPAGLNCEAELFLGPDDVTKVASSGRVPFVSTGAPKNVNLPITMPAAQGTYHGYIDVFAEGLRFLAYKTTEDIQIIATVVKVKLKNPPPGATKWFMKLVDWDITQILSWWGTEDPPEYNNIAEIANFDIPSTWKLPFRIEIYIYKYILWEGQPAFQQLYRVQSWQPEIFPGEPNPSYREIFIPSVGNWYYNVATQGFEKI